MHATRRPLERHPGRDNHRMAVAVVGEKGVEVAGVVKMVAVPLESVIKVT